PWRWRWDLNPRRSCPLTRFRGVLLRPLGHSTAGKGTGRALAPVAREEVAEQRSALIGEYAGNDLGAVVGTPVAHQVPDGTGRTGLRVVGAVHDPVEAGEHRCTGAHDARLERDDE